MDVPGNAFLAEVAAAVIAGPLLVSEAVAPILHLASAIFTPGPTLTPASFTEATYEGYATVLMQAWPAPVLTPNGNVSVNASNIAVFQPTGTTTPNTIYGWWLQDHAGNVVCCNTFPTPIVMDSPANQIALVVGWAVGPWSYTYTLLP